jgi:hypothetical protein
VAEPHSLAFVDSISATATVRLDMSGTTRGPFNLRDGTRFDPPPLKRSIPSSLLADGGVAHLRGVRQPHGRVAAPADEQR